MYDDGFDGIDAVALAVPRAEPLVELYQQLLGFGIVADDAPGDPALAAMLGAERAPSRIVHLSRGAEAGGAIALVETGGGAPASTLTPPARPGPYALDFYLRNAAATEDAMAAAGWQFTSPAVHYDLPGTSIPVRERMLIQPHSGLLHAMVQHRPTGTRSVLGHDEAGRASEVVAIVILTRDLDGARAFAGEVLGGHAYYNGVFAGPAMEEMLGFDPGFGLDASLYRGPESRNARLEFARPVDADGSPLPWTDQPRAAVTPCLFTADVDSLLAQVSDHGEVVLDHPVPWVGGQRRAVRFASNYDVDLCLIEQR